MVLSRREFANDPAAGCTTHFIAAHPAMWNEDIGEDA